MGRINELAEKLLGELSNVPEDALAAANATTEELFQGPFNLDAVRRRLKEVAAGFPDDPESPEEGTPDADSE